MSIPTTVKHAGNGKRGRDEHMNTKKGVPLSITRREKQHGRLYELRMQQNLSQNELADRAGISRNTIMRIENGDSIPNISTYQKICAALHIDLSDLFK